MKYFFTKRNIKQHIPAILDVVGIFCLSSFINVTVFQEFIVETLPNCKWWSAIIITVNCDSGALNWILKYYLNLYSPFTILPAMLFVVGSIFMAGNIIQSFASLVFTLTFVLSVFTAFRALWFIPESRKVTRESDYKRHRKLNFYLWAILIPFCILSVGQLLEKLL